MRPILLLSVLVVIGVASVSAGLGAGAATPPPRPVVVELFTSQGCSSCPPADALLSRLGDDVIALAFHVDYWDGIGWPDPFAAPDWTRRQHAYARAFETSRVYTPQAVIHGGRHVVGSDRRAVASALDAERQRQATEEVDVSARLVGDVVEIDVTVAPRVSRDDDARSSVWIAITDSGHETAVPRGENARRTLRNDHVVRHFSRLDRLPEAAGASSGAERVAWRRETSLRVGPTWRTEDLRVVALVQTDDSMQILGAAATRPAAVE